MADEFELNYQLVNQDMKNLIHGMVVAEAVTCGIKEIRQEDLVEILTVEAIHGIVILEEDTQGIHFILILCIT